MNARILISLAIMLIAVIGAVASYFLLGEIAAIVLIAAIAVFATVLCFFVWSEQGGSDAPANVGTKAVGAIATLCSGSFSAALLKAYGGKIGIPPQLPIEFLAISAFGVGAVLIVVWLARKDTTITGRQSGDVSKDVGEIGFTQKLERIAQVLENRLTRLDEEANWTDQAFNPLDAEIERLSVTGTRSWKLGDLVTSIRRDHKAKGFLVLGDPGSGKSVAMRHLVRHMLKEVSRTGVLPIYVNLKEWSDSDKLVHAASQADIFAFVCDYFKMGGIDLIVEFADRYLKRLFEVGRLFIIFDSFDETPVLLDRDETSEVIERFSDKIEEFMIGPHMSRCVIASRYYRRPRFRSAELVQLEILPLSRRKIRETLLRSNRISVADIDRLLTSRNEWIDVMKNPFVANLVISYISRNRGAFPVGRVEVYEDYIKGRLERLDRTLHEYQLTKEMIERAATLISYKMFSQSNIGLEASVDEIADWLKQEGETDRHEDVVDILERARLIRRSPHPAQKISFVHRRFNEYFLARATEIGMTKADLDSIVSDRRDRDALVLYVEIAPEEEAQRIAQYCWNQISSATSFANDGPLGELAALRATYSLRFLIDAFTSSKKHCIDLVASPIYDFLSDAIEAHRTNMLHAKIAVEAAGILDDERASEVVAKALLTGNRWIMETGVRASRSIQAISKNALLLIARYFWEMAEVDLLRRGAEFTELFKLNSAFSSVRKVIKFRLRFLIFQCLLRFAGMVMSPALYVISFLNQMVTSSWFANRPRRIPMVAMRYMNLSRPENLFTIPAFLWLITIITSLFFADRKSPEGEMVLFWRGSRVALQPGQSAIFEAVLIMGVGVACTAALYWAIKSVSLEQFRRAALRAMPMLGSFTLLSVALVVVVTRYPRLLTIVIICCAVGSAVIFGTLLIPELVNFSKQRRELKATSDVDLCDRASIERLFLSLQFERLRLKLVTRIDELHRRNGTRPTGRWSTVAAPNLLDAASIRLSQLDESWTGLER
jgi:hypothetical protein